MRLRRVTRWGKTPGRFIRQEAIEDVTIKQDRYQRPLVTIESDEGELMIAAPLSSESREWVRGFILDKVAR